ncbi:MAG: helix-turn-helix transcriptional regulator [Clostridia bacterium]|nr:helix-turn-helix transcriptional regulator [Clostridia bacterium]
MAVGGRIKRIRNVRGLTQKEPGLAIGFDDNAADVRMAQYESGTRTPKEKLINDIAATLNVSPQALSVPNIESSPG